MPKELVKNRHSQAPFRFPGSSVSIESACNTGDPGSIPGSGRSPGEGNGNPLQYSFLGNPMDRGAWRARLHSGLVHRVIIKSDRP